MPRHTESATRSEALTRPVPCLCSIVCWFIQDAAKVVCYRFLKKYNIFDINGTKSKKAATAALEARL